MRVGIVTQGGFAQDALKAGKELEENYECPPETKKHVHLSASFHS
jgi:hypothetical protein